MHSAFLECLHERRLAQVRFLSKSGGGYVVRTCAPVDFGPWARVKDGRDRYHFIDLDGTGGPHPACLLPEQITLFSPTDDVFDPAELVTWDLRKYPWHVSRDWGRFS